MFICMCIPLSSFLNRFGVSGWDYVANIVTLRRGFYLRAMLNMLEELQVYNIHWQVLDTAQNGIPHNRRRLRAYLHPFNWRWGF